MIQSHGSAKPKVFFIGDEPHGEDLRSNYALSGYAGNLLAQFCREQGLYFEEFWKTLLIKEELPKNSAEDVIEERIKTFSPLLIEEINTLRPNLLCPLGELSFKWLTGLDSIRKFRGSVLPINGSFGIEKPTKVMPILGPYPFLNQEYRLRYITRIDFSKIKRNYEEGPPPDNLYNIWVCRSSTALRNFFERSYQKAIESNLYVVFDIETYMQIPICISFCFDGFESVCIPLVDQSIEFDQRTLMMDLVARMLNSPIRKVNQNIKYDWKILERWGFNVRNVAGDTMLAASTLYCEFPKNLGFLTSIYTNIPYFKDEGKSFDPERTRRDRYYLYNAKDSLATHQIFGQQEQEVAELGTKGVYDNLIRCMPIYKRAENRGIRIDEERREKLQAKYESLYHIQELTCRNLLSTNYFNPLSPKQCKEVIYDQLGYNKVRGIKINKDGSPGTDEESLDLLTVYGEAKRAPSTGPMVLSSIIAARKIKKVLELLELPLHPDKKFRCEFNLAGTENGRSSGGKTTDQLAVIEKGKAEVYNLGHSLQTIGKHGFMIDGRTYGKDIRSIFIPSPGYIFVEVDLSQAEARVDTVLSKNFNILSVFDGPIGIHKLTGSWVFSCPPEEIKKNTLVDGVDRYHMAKTVRHAGERNMGPERMVMMTQQPLIQCARILRTFHTYQPEIKDVFHREIMNVVDLPEHRLVAPNGRRRDFFDRIDKHTYNEAISFLPQAIVSDQTKFSFIETFSNCPWAYLLTEQHDGALAEVPIGREMEYAEEYKKNVEQPIDFRSCTLSRDFELVIPCEVSIGMDWNNLKEVKL